jgi:hypothetical protein
MAKSAAVPRTQRHENDPVCHFHFSVSSKKSKHMGNSEKQALRTEQQKLENFCKSLTNPRLVGKGRKNYKPHQAKVEKQSERMESPESRFSNVAKSRNFNTLSIKSEL